MNPDGRLPRQTALGLMALCGFCWSTAGALIKLVDWGPMAVAFGRSLIAFVALGGYLVLIGRRVVVSRTILLAAAVVCVKYICFVTANKLTSGANVIAIQYTSPIFVLLFSVLFLRQTARRKDVLVAVLSAAGVALLVLDGLTPSGMAGNALALVSGVMTAVMYLVMGRLERYEETLSVTVLGHGLVALCTLPFVLRSPPQITGHNLAGVLLLGLVQQSVAYILYSFAIRNASAVACSVIACVDPLLNPIWLALLVGEVPGPFATLGFVVVLGAITAWSVSDARQAGARTDA